MERVTREEAIEHASSLNFNGMWATEFAIQNHYNYFGELVEFIVDCIKAVEMKYKMLYKVIKSNKALKALKNFKGIKSIMHYKQK